MIDIRGIRSPHTIWLTSPPPCRPGGGSRPTSLPLDVPIALRGPATMGNEWNPIREAAGPRALRIHDLRHSHATVAVNGGEGVHLVAGLLVGYRHIRPNQRQPLQEVATVDKVCHRSHDASCSVHKEKNPKGSVSLGGLERRRWQPLPAGAVTRLLGSVVARACRASPKVPRRSWSKSRPVSAIRRVPAWGTQSARTL